MIITTTNKLLQLATVRQRCLCHYSCSVVAALQSSKSTSLTADKLNSAEGRRSFYKATVCHSDQQQRESAPSTPKTVKDPVDVNKIEHFKQNPYFAKYESKLKTLYAENPEVFLETLRNVKPEKVGDGIPGLELFSGVGNSHMQSALNKKRTLESIMKLELVANLPAEEIRNIWTIYMKERGRFADILSVKDFEKLKSRSKQFTTFLLALPRDQGYEFVLAQWSKQSDSLECHFTSLINFQAHGENAPSCLSVVYFDELAVDKQVVLEMAELDERHLKRPDAAFLLHQMKQYYLNDSSGGEPSSGDSASKLRLVECFNRTPHLFKHMDLVRQIEKDNLTLEQFKDA